MRITLSIIMLLSVLGRCVFSHGDVIAVDQPKVEKIKTPFKGEVTVTYSSGAKATCKIQAVTLDELNFLTLKYSK